MLLFSPDQQLYTAHHLAGQKASRSQHLEEQYTLSPPGTLNFLGRYLELTEILLENLTQELQTGPVVEKTQARLKHC